MNQREKVDEVVQEMLFRGGLNAKPWAIGRIIALWDEEWMEIQAKLADAVRERDHYQRTVAKMAEELDHLQSRESEADGIVRELRDSVDAMLPYAEDFCHNTDDDKELIARADAWLAGAAPAQTEDELGKVNLALEYCGNECKLAMDKAIKAEAEVRRLKDALEQISNYVDSDAVWTMYRSALEGGEK